MMSLLWRSSSASSISAAYILALSSVNFLSLCSILPRSPLNHCLTNIVLPWTEIKNEEQFGLGLEGVVEVNDERVLRVRQHIALGLGVSHQVLAHDPLLAQHFHCIKLARSLFLHQIHLTKTATAKNFDDNKVVRPHLFIFNQFFLHGDGILGMNDDLIR